MKNNISHAPPPQSEPHPRLTVLGLFEDVIDANHALADLRDGPLPPEAVSLIVREDGAEDPDEIPRAADVVTALSEAELNQAGEWLMHLVSLILRREGAFLVAGPIGAILSGSESVARRSDVSDVSLEDSARENTGRSEERPIVSALVGFGYGEEEADYLAQRVIAGSVLIGITTADSEQASGARRIFADRDAVHIGTNWTHSDTAMHAEMLVHAPVETASDEKVVVFDSVPLLVGLCHHQDPNLAATCGGAMVVDRHGDEIGIIEDLLADIETREEGRSDTAHVRYVVIGFGGLLGVGKSFVAVPAMHVTLDADPITLDTDRQMLHAAPLYNANRPFSRREEELVCDHFGCPRYWL